MKKMMNMKQIVLLFAVLFPLIAHPQAGKSGLAFLKLGVSGRTVAMGDAASAAARGATATHYNPAGILSKDASSVEFLFMHKEWIQDVRSEFLGVGVQLDESSAVALSVNTATVSEIEIRTRPGTSEGTFTSRDFSFGLSYAREMSEDLKLGITAKYLFEKIFLDEAGGVGFDLGAQYKTPVENLSAGLVLANIGSMGKFRAEKIALPALARVGPAYSLNLEDLTSTAVLAGDLLYIFPEKKVYLNIGGEVVFDNVVAARLGYQLGSNGRGFSAGVGVKYEVFNLDYGFVPLSSNLGSGHTFSIGLNL
jgi:hypothetical protein